MNLKTAWEMILKCFQTVNFWGFLKQKTEMTSLLAVVAESSDA